MKCRLLDHVPPPDWLSPPVKCRPLGKPLFVRPKVPAPVKVPLNRLPPLSYEVPPSQSCAAPRLGAAPGQMPPSEQAPCRAPLSAAPVKVPPSQPGAPGQVPPLRKSDQLFFGAPLRAEAFTPRTPSKLTGGANAQCAPPGCASASEMEGPL